MAAGIGAHAYSMPLTSSTASRDLARHVITPAGRSAATVSAPALWCALTLAADAGTSPTPLAHVTQLHLTVTDVLKSAAFYRDTLGLKQELAVPEIAVFELGTFKLMLGPGKPLRPAKCSGNDEGISLSFQVDDLAATSAALQRRGLTVTRGPKKPSGGQRLWVKDPDGYAIEYERLDPPGQWRRGLAYREVDGESLLADAFVPDGNGPFPALIVVHGGGFTAGDRVDHVKPLLDLLTDGAWAVITVDYRLAPKHRYPAPVEDVERAVDWVHAHATELKVDPSRVALVGESAGGYLAALVGARAQGRQRVKAVVAFYAAHDQETWARHAGALAGSTQALYGLTGPDPAALKLLRAASPIHAVSAKSPPFLLIHGTADEQVPYEQSTLMCTALWASGAQCELYSVPGGAHGLNSWEGDTRLTLYKARLTEWLLSQL
jgi:alpha-L-fucosidase 2